MPDMILKACSKYGGDLLWDEDEQEWCCIQAGHRFSQEEMEEKINKAAEERRARELPPVPPAPELHGRRGGRKNLLAEYYEQNKERIIADIKTIGETATRKRWWILPHHWTTLKRRWGLPVNKRGRKRLVGDRLVKVEPSKLVKTGNPAVPLSIRSAEKLCWVIMVSSNGKNRLPALPEWNDGWPDEVKLRWLSLYGELVRC
jgi:hypothetical protein